MRKKKPLRELTTHELIHGAGVMKYENWMFRGAGGLFTDYGPGGFLGNLALEGTLLHARNLAEFFLDERKYEDDIRAADYLPPSPSPRTFGMEYLASKETRSGLNKRLSHPSNSRLLLKRDSGLFEKGDPNRQRGTWTE